MPTDLPEYALTAPKLLAAQGLDEPLRPNVVLVYDEALAPHRRFRLRRRRVQYPFRRVESMNDQVDLVVAAGPGAPVAAITVALLATLGVRRIVAVGTAGLLTEGDESLRVITQCESDEGTSSHFEGELSASANLSLRLASVLDAKTATALTTDIPFRQTDEQVQSNRARADVVEMECAALFAAANEIGLDVAAVVAISDVFASDGWRRCEGKVTQWSLRAALAGAVEVLTSKG